MQAAVVSHLEFGHCLLNIAWRDLFLSNENIFGAEFYYANGVIYSEAAEI